VTDFESWCQPAAFVKVKKHTAGMLLSNDDSVGIDAVAATLAEKYAETETLALIAEKLGKQEVAKFLRHRFPTKANLNFSRDLFGSDVVRAGRRVGLIVPDGYGRSAGVARGRAFHGRWGPRVGWRVSCCSGEGGPKSLPSFGYRGGPAPGGVDA
jgi:hypothetical protein